MTTLTRESPAKINLTLRVVGVRPDGFHEIESLVAQVDLCDTVSVVPREDRRFLVECDDRTIPCDRSNLALRAARALAKSKGVRRGALITLVKRIPAGTGLGGGSSNAAATLKLLNALWRLGLSHPELATLGASLGSDVPLFCHGPLCVIRGRGEQVEELKQQVTAWAALVLPALHCSTPDVYAAWDWLSERPQRPALNEVQAELGSATRTMELSFNDLEAAAFEVEPQLRRLADRVTEVGGLPVRLTGSGSALFRLFEDEAGATRFAAEIDKKLGVRTAVAKLRAS